ncbi:helix-turn-helix domain-containing protein [Klebsiella pneumoniae]|uniref:helix-turn-helix domain-containing protein n=1 Tax=Klebsiella pneumoniae TaxID=573 RepID=UPI001D0D2267|nr:helix-turn-helix domain-containing protein [Klebsiella pneumoniae]
MIDRMKTRGERLKARRLELKMTLKQVAQSVGISLPGVQNLERGDVMPSLEIGLALAKCCANLCNGYFLVLNLILTAFLLLAQQRVVRIATGSQENLPTQNDFLPFVSQRETVYALTVGNQVQHSYQPGDVVLVDSALTPVPGEDVLVCDKDGKISIQRLARFDDERYYLDGVNSQRVIHEKSDLQFVHQIVGTIKSFMIEGR